MLENLIPSRRQLTGQDPIFALHAQARARREAGEPVLDATLGVLVDDAGRQVFLRPVMELWSELTAEEVAPYAPITGSPAFLEALVRRHWPDLDGSGAGCATPGGSGALALSLRNLLEPGMTVLGAGPFWGPYAVLAAENGCRLASAPFPLAGAPLDLDAWELKARALMASQGRLLVWLNDPCHNPTGRSLGRGDRDGLLAMLRELSRLGPVSLILDCAYVDYTPDPAHVREALDHYRELGEEGRVLVGASLSMSKAFTLYGARGGALVFPWCRDEELQAALAASCRGLFSNCPRAAQSLLLRLERDGKRQERLAREHRHWSEILEVRALALDEALRSRGLPGAPWMGGFFVTLPVVDPPLAAARLRERGTFLVPVAKGLRVGICGLPAEDAGLLAQGFAEINGAG